MIQEFLMQFITCVFSHEYINTKNAFLIRGYEFQLEIYIQCGKIRTRNIVIRE